MIKLLSKYGLIWAVVYGVLNVLSNQLVLPAAPFIALRPQVALPMSIGFIYGPLPGFITGALGNIIGDGLSHYGVFTFWNWHLANGLMGLIPGLIILYPGIRIIKTVRGFGLLEAVVVIASAVAVVVAVVLDVLFIGMLKFPASLNEWILPAFITDAVNGFVFVPVLCLFARRIEITLETRTIMTITSMLVISVLSTSFAITWAVWDDLKSMSAMIETFYFAGIVTVALLVIGFGSSIFFVRRITVPLIHLTRAAESIEKGEYDLPALASVSERTDEFGQLARLFQDMAVQVHEREKLLKQTVEQLQVRIDRKRQAEDVAEIVETDYFQNLKEKVREMRKT
jgi:uncharacterized membrane protein/HAMP domain-containing protein